MGQPLQHIRSLKDLITNINLLKEAMIENYLNLW